MALRAGTGEILFPAGHQVGCWPKRLLARKNGVAGWTPLPRVGGPVPLRKALMRTVAEGMHLGWSWCT